ncbi:NAD(P)/FAD-dependent oxidoreductase [Nocardioides albus]|uniref:3-phenylpropionate/trans-cinnamate dioxygenase ferredoxin reductase subunit n=1 Tax=Nocardioides albus TaxID=1841 RepID=A0A7W5F9M7_9ACTN|nr:FAD-dependent oxidoreductase [Nocardioides albus]MBB3090474.1 3-phenylpropionate/trans-cinnamate dioxygenase ferredoxin reductase subunit [Nocardioides albus]GGU24182.1 pyridine nucleotide-disulfide oxidoreductase [Nocardioides albus]
MGTGARGDVVIIGAGLAAVSAIETLREEGYAGPLILVGKEPELPYERPQLSKDFLAGAKEFKVVHDEAWYAEKDVTVLAGTTVTALDLKDGSVTLDDGKKLAFGRLLLATGADPKTPPIPGIETAVTLRTVEDARRLKEAVREGTRVVTVGGGWIGLEVAASVTALGGTAVVLEAAAQPLLNVLGPVLAEHVADLHTRHGVEIHTETTVEAIEPGVVRTSAGEIPADIVLVAVGAAPATDLAADAGLEVGDGIVVDERLRTSDPRVFAAGDVALAKHTVHGPLRVEHWDNAIKQGRLAARSMLGKEGAYDWQPYFFTDQFEFSMEYVGRSAPEDEVLLRGDTEGDEFIAYWQRGRTVTAGMNVGIWDVNDKLRELVGTEADPDQLTDLS